jgi:hypothetical protein
MAARLAKQMASYSPYVDPSLSTEELSKYECVSTNVSGGVFPSPFWGEFCGPVRPLHLCDLPTDTAEACPHLTV